MLLHLKLKVTIMMSMYNYCKIVICDNLKKKDYTRFCMSLPSNMICLLLLLPTAFVATQVYDPESDVYTGINVKEGLLIVIPIVPVVPWFKANTPLSVSLSQYTCVSVGFA